MSCYNVCVIRRIMSCGTDIIYFAILCTLYVITALLQARYLYFLLGGLVTLSHLSFGIRLNIVNRVCIYHCYCVGASMRATVLNPCFRFGFPTHNSRLRVRVRDWLHMRVGGQKLIHENFSLFIFLLGCTMRPILTPEYRDHFLKPHLTVSTVHS